MNVLRTAGRSSKKGNCNSKAWIFGNTLIAHEFRSGLDFDFNGYAEYLLSSATATVKRVLEQDQRAPIKVDPKLVHCPVPSVETMLLVGSVLEFATAQICEMLCDEVGARS